MQIYMLVDTSTPQVFKDFAEFKLRGNTVCDIIGQCILEISVKMNIYNLLLSYLAMWCF